MAKKEEKEYTLSGLYYNYKKVSDEDIQKYLERIKILKKQEKGVGTIYGYYPLNAKAIADMSKKPRNVSLTFDATNTEDTPITDLVKWKTIVFLVKSSSRFFLKPDIGEVFDQIPWQDLFGCNDIKGICVNLDTYETLPDTEGEHFLMEADLLTDEKTLAIKKLHEL